jgi:hypothetical protein
MLYEIKTNNKPCTIKLGVQTLKPTKVQLVVKHPTKPNTCYMNRWNTVDKNGEFEIRMPKTPEKVIIICGSMTESNDIVRITSLKKDELKQDLKCLKGTKVNEFVKFCQEFCENCGILSTGTYKSDKGNFTIEYHPVILEKGKPHKTPARIHNETGLIQVSKKHFVGYTVPMRMAILLHEFSHYNLNVNIKDEVEADLNALRLYLGLGYPIIEAHRSFLNVFYQSPSEQNIERYKYIKTFIDNFDSIKHKFC